MSGAAMRGTTMEDLIGRSIESIRKSYGDPLRLDDLARTAMMSKFHFLRTFRQHTGLTPLRFLSAVRIHEAKRLLFATPMNVATISIEVGYGSLGTFSRRFTECVGLSPTLYRRMSRGELPQPASYGAPVPRGRHHGEVFGTVTATPDSGSPVFIGVFPGRLPQGQPVAWTGIPKPGSWRIPAVPIGTWHVVAVAAADDMTGQRSATPGQTGHPMLVGTSGELVIRADTNMRADLTVELPATTSPPLLAALPDVEVLNHRAAPAA